MPTIQLSGCVSRNITTEYIVIKVYGIIYLMSERRMRKTRLLLTAVIVVFMVVTSASAGGLKKRHQIELRLGLWNQTTETRTEVRTEPIGTTSTTVNSTGFLGGLTYGHWLQENVALNLRVGVLTAEVETETGVYPEITQTATVTQFLLGLKFYLPQADIRAPIRPYAGIFFGSFVGHQARIEEGRSTTVDSRLEAAPGGQISAGVDFILGRRIMTSIAAGYNLMADFDQPVGGSDNYSGTELSFGLSFLIG